MQKTPYTIELYPGKGFSMSGINSTPVALPAVHDRGKIKGWSAKSRRRMRETMLTLAPPEGWHCHGVSLTIPGPVLPVEDKKNLWHAFSRCIQKKGWGMIWRLEVQTRGQSHWHCIVVSPRAAGQCANEALSLPLAVCWMDCLHDMGPVGHITNRGFHYQNIHRDNLPGAWGHATHFQNDGGGKVAWLRYLQDHASKSSEQVAEGFGRHWGVVGRRVFELAKHSTVTLQPHDYYRVLRWVQRLATPSFPDARFPGFRRLGYRPSFGRRGLSVRFTRPETLQRMIDYATTHPTPPRPDHHA